MLLFAHTAGPRLLFLLRFLSDYFRHPFTVTTSADHFRAAEGPKAGYAADQEFSPFLLCRPSGFLDEKGFRPFAPDCRMDGLFPVLFPEREGEGFDIFSAIFYLISRYEEYGHPSLDGYGRFDYRASAAWRHGFLHRPLVNEWLEALRPRLIHLGAPISAAPPPRRWCPTYDIDIAWSYRGKGWKRNLGGAFRDAAHLRWERVKERVQVVAGQRSDPYDAYDFMEALHRQGGERPRFFMHTGGQRNRYDKNIPASFPPWQSLVRRLAALGPVGLHPSWASFHHPSLLEEKKTLESVLGEEAGASRQHYIRFRLPDTFRHLLEAGIRDDYSMGYGSVNGYRASVAHPFPWYDLEREAATPLTLHPFAWMDANALFEQEMSPESGVEELKGYWEGLRKTGGTLITIAHNTFLGTDPLFRGWREAYADFSAWAYPPPDGKPNG